MSKKFQLSEEGKSFHPEHIGNKWVASTWKRKNIDGKFLDEVETVSEEVETIPEEKTEKVLTWSKDYITFQTGSEYCGVSKSREEWVEIFGHKYVRSLIGTGKLS